MEFSDNEKRLLEEAKVNMLKKTFPYGMRFECLKSHNQFISSGEIQWIREGIYATGGGIVADFVAEPGCTHLAKTISMDASLVEPPIGLMPEWLSKEIRLKEILAAIKRYTDAGFAVPKEWSDEERSIVSWQVMYKSFKETSPGPEIHPAARSHNKVIDRFTEGSWSDSNLLWRCNCGHMNSNIAAKENCKSCGMKKEISLPLAENGGGIVPLMEAGKITEQIEKIKTVKEFFKNVYEVPDGIMPGDWVVGMNRNDKKKDHWKTRGRFVGVKGYPMSSEFPETFMYIVEDSYDHPFAENNICHFHEIRRTENPFEVKRQSEQKVRREKAVYIFEKHWLKEYGKHPSKQTYESCAYIIDAIEEALTKNEK